MGKCLCNIKLSVHLMLDWGIYLYPFPLVHIVVVTHYNLYKTSRIYIGIYRYTNTLFNAESTAVERKTP